MNMMRVVYLKPVSIPIPSVTTSKFGTLTVCLFLTYYTLLCYMP